MFDKKWSIADIPEDYLTGEDNLHLLAIGKIAEEEEGCACAMGFTAKMFLDNIETGDNDVVITDTEAGVEHFGRGVDRNADIILIVIDPSYESIRLSEKVYDMGSSLGKPVYFIINKADKDQAEMIKEAITYKSAIIAEIPAYPEIMMAGLKGERLNCKIPEIYDVMASSFLA